MILVCTKVCITELQDSPCVLCFIEKQIIVTCGGCYFWFSLKAYIEIQTISIKYLIKIISILCTWDINHTRLKRKKKSNLKLCSLDLFCCDLESFVIVVINYYRFIFSYFRNKFSWLSLYGINFPKICLSASIICLLFSKLHFITKKQQHFNFTIFIPTTRCLIFVHF